MAIYRLLAKSPLGPEEIDILVQAYEATLRALHLVDRNDPITELIAKKIIKIGQTGLRDPAQISAQALKSLEYRPSHTCATPALPHGSRPSPNICGTGSAR